MGMKFVWSDNYFIKLECMLLRIVLLLVEIHMQVVFGDTLVQSVKRKMSSLVDMLLDLCRTRNRIEKPSEPLACSALEKVEEEATKSTASVSDLPAEVLVEVFSRLSCQDLLSVEKVCKRWRDSASINWSTCRRLVLRCPDSFLWRTRFTKRDEIYLHQVERVATRRSSSSSSKTTHVFSEPKVYNVVDVRSLMRKASGLVELNLAELKVEKMSEACLGVNSTNQPPLSASAKSDLLMQLIADECSCSLQRLDLRGLKMTHSGFTKLVDKCSRALKEISLDDYEFCLSDELLVALFRACPNIEVLRLVNCDEISDKCFEALATRRLTCLTIDGCEQLTDLTLNAICQAAASTLTTLQMRGCKRITTQAICNALRKLRALKVVDIRPALYEGVVLQLTCMATAELPFSINTSDDYRPAHCDSEYYDYTSDYSIYAYW